MKTDEKAPVCQLKDWYVELKISSSTFKSPQSVREPYYSEDGQELWFDKNGASISYYGFMGLLRHTEFKKFISDAKQMMEDYQKIADKPFDSCQHQSEDVVDLDVDNNDEDDYYEENKKKKTLKRDGGKSSKNQQKKIKHSADVEVRIFDEDDDNQTQDTEKEKDGAEEEEEEEDTPVTGGGAWKKRKPNKKNLFNSANNKEEEDSFKTPPVLTRSKISGIDKAPAKRKVANKNSSKKLTGSSIDLQNDDNDDNSEDNNLVDSLLQSPSQSLADGSYTSD